MDRWRSSQDTSFHGLFKFGAVTATGCPEERAIQASDDRSSSWSRHARVVGRLLTSWPSSVQVGLVTEAVGVSVEEVEAVLARAEEEAAKLRGRLHELESNIARLRVYLDKARADEARRTSNVPTQPANVRLPRGALKAAGEEAIRIIRESGKPWHSRDLLKEVRRRGFHVGSANPLVALSNHLGRTGVLRSHPRTGWHLKEWPELPDPSEERLAILRAQLAHGQAEVGTALAQVPPDSENEADPFYGKGLPEAGALVLSKVGRPMRNAEIADQLSADGYQHTQKDAPGAVESAMRRRARSPGDVVRVAPGTWGMVAWYTQTQLDEIARSMSGVPGRNFREHLENTRAGVEKAKERGVRFGRLPKTDPLQLAKARQFITDGVPPRDVAKLFNVSPSTVYRWVAMWAEEGAPPQREVTTGAAEGKPGGG